MMNPQTPISKVLKSEIRISKSETNPNDKNPKLETGVLNFEYLNFEFVSDFVLRALNLFCVKFFRRINLSPKTYHLKHNCGFSLIELMVTTSVIVIISSIVLFNFPSFASRILLENLTHEIALVVRQAQVYGIGIKRQAGTANVFPAYGTHFDISATPTEDPPNKKVIFFADTSPPAGDGVYTAGNDVALETFTIQRGNIINELCYDVSCISTDTVDVTFKRPEPEAHIRVNGGVAEVSSAKITVTSPNPGIGARYITVYSSGQIAVTAE